MAMAVKQIRPFADMAPARLVPPAINVLTAATPLPLPDSDRLAASMVALPSG
jgi:hypothetical protein